MTFETTSSARSSEIMADGGRNISFGEGPATVLALVEVADMIVRVTR